MGIDGKSYTDLSRPYEKLMSEYGSLLEKFETKKKIDAMIASGINSKGEPVTPDQKERSLESWSYNVEYTINNFKEYYDKVMAF